MTWRCYLNRDANTFWVDNRLRSQRVSARTLTIGQGSDLLVRERTRSKSAVRTVFALLPFSMILGMILLAAGATCVTMYLRYRTERVAATVQFERANTEVGKLRDANSVLSLEIKKLRSDPRTIEFAARQRLGMVRHNEIVVPIE